MRSATSRAVSSALFAKSEPGPRDPFGRKNARIRKANKTIAAEHGCIITGRKDGIDPAHLPYSQKDGAGWGLLEFVPLDHYLHRAYDLGDPHVIRMVDLCSRLYYDMMLRTHQDMYLGPEWRIEQVRASVV